MVSKQTPDKHRSIRSSRDRLRFLCGRFRLFHWLGIHIPEPLHPCQCLLPYFPFVIHTPPPPLFPSPKFFFVFSFLSVFAVPFYLYFPIPPLPPLWLIMCHGSHFPTFPIFFFCERSAGSSGSWIFLYSHLREATKTYEQCFGSRWICFFSPIRKRTSKTRILIHPFFAFVYSKITDEN